MEDYPKSDYSIYFVHQLDSRGFNRGAVKNIGFLAMKEKYPNDYKKITFVFNDVDTMPYTKNFLNYKTTPGVIKHFYGYTHALGGIVSICGEDFEKMGGFPNFWAWGYEDNMLNVRAIRQNIMIDRSQFYPIMDKNIFQMKDSLMRTVNRDEFDRYASDTTEGFSDIINLQYDIDEENGVIGVKTFLTAVQENESTNTNYDLRNGNKVFPPSINSLYINKTGQRRRPAMGMRL